MSSCVSELLSTGQGAVSTVYQPDIPRSRVQTEHSEVCTHDRGQDSPIQTDLARLIRCLLYGKEENFNSFHVTGLLTF